MQGNRNASFTSGRSLAALLVIVAFASVLSAQGPVPQPVQWKVSPVTKGHDAFTVQATATLDAGWHVYAQHQLPDGPTPLRISLDDANLAEIAGPIGGTAPTRHEDPSFKLTTEVYLGDFKLVVPIHFKPGHEAASTIPLAIRYQACNDRICLPPRTVHFSASTE